jgi:hypothetical protein
MTRIIHYAAVIANILAVLATLFFIVTQARGQEVALFALFLIPPILSLVALIDVPGLEERRLARQLRLLRLKKELSALGD